MFHSVQSAASAARAFRRAGRTAPSSAANFIASPIASPSGRFVACLAALAVLLPPAALAGEASVDAHITLVSPLQISAQRDLNFGAMTRTSGGETVWKLNADGSLEKVRGNGLALDGGLRHTGLMRLSGIPGRAFSLSVDSDDAASDGLRATSGVTYTSVGSSSGSLPASGVLEIAVGGRLTIGVSAVSGTHQIGTLTLTVDY